MIKFEIDESLMFRGGSFYTSFHANSMNVVIEELRSAWFANGLDKYGGELFLTAVIKDGNNQDVSLYIGHCTFDKRGRSYFPFEEPYGDEKVDEWNSLGIFVDGFGDDVRYIFDALFNYDSPDRVLGSYLYRLSKGYKKLTAKERKSFGKNILANILDFAKKQKKLEQMYLWLSSQEGLDYLAEGKYFDPAGISLCEALEIPLDLGLDQYIEVYKKDFDTAIYLPSNYQ